MKRIAALVWLVASLSLTTYAQSPNASLGGRVTDVSKAVIVNARIHAINVGTNILYEGATNCAGEYYIPNLLPGTYRIEALVSSTYTTSRFHMLIDGIDKTGVIGVPSTVVASLRLPTPTSTRGRSRVARNAARLPVFASNPGSPSAPNSTSNSWLGSTCRLRAS